MIPKLVGNIGEYDLLLLIENKVREGKTIDYKRVLPGKSDKDKIEFLKDVSSFSNTDGGDLIYGIDEKEGLPVLICGIIEENQDTLKLRLENICRDGLEPRLPHLDFHFVATAQGLVLVIRATNSWSGPHRVKYNNHAQFYGRNTAGAYRMDVGQLRSAFTKSESIAERIRSFRNERLANLHSHNTPVKIKQGCKMALHLIPVSAFASSDRIDISAHHLKLAEIQPMCINPGTNKINLDGIVSYDYSEDGRSPAYTQVFRTGIIEAVVVFGEGDDGKKRIHSVSYEDLLIKAAQKYLQVMESLDIATPIYMYLSFLEVTDVNFLIPYLRSSFYETVNADRDALVLPEVVINDYEHETDKLLRPAFDMVWNSFGYSASQNYDEAGKWQGKQQ